MGWEAVSAGINSVAVLKDRGKVKGREPSDRPFVPISPSVGIESRMSLASCKAGLLESHCPTD